MRIILFTGKGGVGKTTISAATALQAARGGKKTLVISTDPAHSLSDALDRELLPEPVEVRPNLYAQEFDVYYSMKKHWGNVRELMLAVFRWQGIENVVAEELSALPGMEEASAFLWLEEYYRRQEYDLIIIDSAPTGETLSLLSLPQVTQSWVMKAFPGQRFAMKSFGAVVRANSGYLMRIKLPFVTEEDFHLSKFGDELVITVGNQRKTIFLPRFANYLQLEGYRFEAPWLEVRLGK